jgi:dihydropteroate synthase
MVVHLINTKDDFIKIYLSNKYKISVDSLSNLSLEIRGLAQHTLLSLKDKFNNLKIKFALKDELNNSNSLLILNNPEFVYEILKDGKFDSDLNQFLDFVSNYFNNKQIVYNVDDKILDFNKTYLMGILNVTPDSFSDGGKYLNPSEAIKKALEMIDDGVDIIDIGGESTRPGSDFVTLEEEKRRIIPVIEELLKIKSDLIISVDTTKSEIARLALEYGVKIINDISAMTLDENMIEVCKKFNPIVILMHMKGIPKTMQNNPTYDEIISDIYDYLYERTSLIKTKGLSKIIIDPGIGFGKSIDDNFNIIKRLNEFKGLGYPILIGLSRKSFIGKTLNLDLNQRDFPSSILEAISIIKSARIIRTHNIKNGRVVIDLLNKILS